jgi:hypothetical protein
MLISLDSQTDGHRDKQRHISVHYGKLVMSQNPEILDIRGYTWTLVDYQPRDSQTVGRFDLQKLAQ